VKKRLGRRRGIAGRLACDRWRFVALVKTSGETERNCRSCWSHLHTRKRA